jgi:glycosyltransferase involved in cell wall biosynthesis
MRIDPAKISVIRPAIDLESSPPLEPPRPGEPLRLLLLGRMSPEKGTELLLEALAVLRPHIDRVRVRVVGNSTPEYLERLLARRDALGLREIVEFLPWRDGIAEIDDAHVVLMCSYNEAFGRVTAEALQRGRPVIAARSGGTCEMVIDGVNGILFTPRAPVSLGQAISRVAADSDLLRTLTQGAREVGSGGARPRELSTPS